MTEREPSSLAWVGLGSNLGRREAILARARAALERLSAVPLLASPVYETEPWGLAGQPPFLNQVVGLPPLGSARELLAALQRIEAAEGRERPSVRWGPRTLDLDLLCWRDLVLSTADISVPHPRLAARRFVLQPWADVAPDLRVPGIEATVAELLARCPDRGAVFAVDGR